MHLPTPCHLRSRPWCEWPVPLQITGYLPKKSTARPPVSIYGFTPLDASAHSLARPATDALPHACTVALRRVILSNHIAHTCHTQQPITSHTCHTHQPITSHSSHMQQPNTLHTRHTQQPTTSHTLHTHQSITLHTCCTQQPATSRTHAAQI